MIKERIKTLLLVSLFIISIFLANQIWIEFPDTFMSSFSVNSNLEDNTEEYILSDIVSPEKYLINFGGNNHTILYSDNDYELWEKGRLILAKIFKSEQLSYKVIDDNQFRKNKDNISIDYYFAQEIHIYLFSKLIQQDVADFVIEKIQSVKNIHIGLGKDKFIVLSDGTTHIKLTSSDLLVSEMIKTINTIKCDEEQTKVITIGDALNVYIPINSNEIKYDLRDNYFVKNEIDSKQKNIDEIAQNFFDKDLAHITKMEEINDSVIYLYNNQSLKIYYNGMVEYKNLIKEPIRSRELYTSLNTAVNFVSNHLGWRQDLGLGFYLKSIENIEWEGSKGYRLKFMYKIDDAQVILMDDKETIQAPIEIEVFNEHIKMYRRQIRINESAFPKSKYSLEIIPPLEILKMEENYQYIIEKYLAKNNLDGKEIASEELDTRILSSINEVYLAYFNNAKQDPYKNEAGKTLVPVWVIDVDGMTFMYHMYSGSQIFWEDSEIPQIIGW